MPKIKPKTIKIRCSEKRCSKCLLRSETEFGIGCNLYYKYTGSLITITITPKGEINEKDTR